MLAATFAQHQHGGTVMKTTVRYALGAAAVAILLQASPANAFLWGLTQSANCSDDWPKWKIVADAAGYALWKATCLDMSGTGSDENLGTVKQGSTAGPGYGSDPKSGFGTNTPVTLPPDRHVAKGTDTGIPVRGGAGPVFQPQRYPIQNQYFRPR
jgi:hypothetical protein